MSRDGRSRRERVIQQHGNTCWLCLEKIHLRLQCPDPMSFTVDHVIPKSQGGSGALHNLRPAHRKCNQNKSSKIPWEYTLDGRQLMIKNQQYIMYRIKNRKTA